MRQTERAEQTRSRILEAAMQEFGVNGYRGGTIGNICHTGINKGLVYHYFANRDELYLECVRISCRKLAEKLDRAAPAGLRNASVLKNQSGNAGDMGDAGSASDVPTDPKVIVQQFMKIRMGFYRDCPNESRILFESLLNTPEELRDRVREILKPLEERNLEIYGMLLSKLELREGMTKARAEKYFILFQNMFNAYFSSPVMQKKSLEERIAQHEQNAPEFLDCMLYGIAKRRS